MSGSKYKRICRRTSFFLVLGLFDWCWKLFDETKNVEAQVEMACAVNRTKELEIDRPDSPTALSSFDVEFGAPDIESNLEGFDDQTDFVP